MPDFPTVLWTKQLTKTFNAKKSAGALLADLELKVVEPALDQAFANHKAWADYAAQSKATAKGLMDQATKLFKQIESGKDEDPKKSAGEINAIAGKIETISQEVKKANEIYAKAFSDDGFRANDLYEAMKKAGYFGVIDEKEARKKLGGTLGRRQGIISADRTVLGDRNRIEEYGKRARALETAAVQVGGKLKAERANFVERVKKMEQLFVVPNTGIDEMFRRLDEKMKQAYDAGKKGPRALAEQKLRLAQDEFPAFQRNLSGTIKTAAVELQALKAVHGKKLYAKLALSKMQKRITTAAEKAKMAKAEISVFPSRMEELIGKLAA